MLRRSYSSTKRTSGRIRPSDGFNTTTQDVLIKDVRAIVNDWSNSLKIFRSSGSSSCNDAVIDKFESLLITTRKKFERLCFLVQCRSRCASTVSWDKKVSTIFDSGRNSTAVSEDDCPKIRAALTNLIYENMRVLSKLETLKDDMRLSQTWITKASEVIESEQNFPWHSNDSRIDVTSLLNYKDDIEAHLKQSEEHPSHLESWNCLSRKYGDLLDCEQSRISKHVDSMTTIDTESLRIGLTTDLLLAVDNVIEEYQTAHHQLISILQMTVNYNTDGIKGCRMFSDKSVVEIMHDDNGLDDNGNGMVDSGISESDSYEDMTSGRNKKKNSEANVLKQYVIKEIMETEISYVKDLQDIVKHYIQKLNPESCFIFGNIEVLYQFHANQFLTCLSKNFQTSESICKLFDTHILSLESMYCQYSSKINGNMSRIETEIDQHILKRLQQEAGHVLPLASYMLKPIQRLTRYALLLKQLKSADVSQLVDGTAQNVENVIKRVDACCDTAAGNESDIGTSGELSIRGVPIELRLSKDHLIMQCSVKEVKKKGGSNGGEGIGGSFRISRRSGRILSTQSAFLFSTHLIFVEKKISNKLQTGQSSNKLQGQGVGRNDTSINEFCYKSCVNLTESLFQIYSCHNNCYCDKSTTPPPPMMITSSDENHFHFVLRNGKHLILVAKLDDLEGKDVRHSAKMHEIFKHFMKNK